MADDVEGRLIVVSHRVPGDRPAAGGLVFALDAMLHRQGGVWIGSAASPSEKISKTFVTKKQRGYSKWTFQVTPQEHDAFYLRYANSVLWPLFHWRSDLMAYDAAAFEGYMAVNRRLAKMIARELKSGDVIWVHDYHFLPLAALLRELGVTNRIGFFLHIPFPNRPDLAALPQSELMAGWLGGYDLCGLQTERDVAACLECLRYADDTGLMPDGKMRVGTRWVTVLSFPIGIDPEVFRYDGAQEQDTVSSQHPIVIGVDRLDYSKGLPQRFKGFDACLNAPERGEVQPTLVQIAPPSRENVAAYQDIRSELDTLAGSINGAHATLDWTPIKYLRRSFSQAELKRMYSSAAVALVTPLADGMNLVAKEYVAAQNPEDPGVLILSKFAGASEQLHAALLVNPYDETEVGQSILQALSMPLAQRIERHRALLACVTDRDIGWWTDCYLRHLQDTTAPQKGVAR